MTVLFVGLKTILAGGRFLNIGQGLENNDSFW